MEIKNYFLIIISGILFGTIPVGSQILGNLGFSVFEASFYSQILPFLFVTPIILLKREYRTIGRNAKFFAIYGLIQGLLQISFFGSVILGAPVAIAAFLLYTQPIYTTIFGKLMLGEAITVRKILSIGIAMLGIVALLNPWNISNNIPTIGIILSLLSGVLLSLWIIYGRMSGLRKFSTTTTLLGQGIFASLWMILLLPLLFLTQDATVVKFSSYPLMHILILILINVFPVIGILAFYQGVKKIPASTSGIILLLEPISAAVLAFFLFAQPISISLLIGGLLILLSNYIVITKNNNQN